jgi:hypothetical protein
MLTTQRPTIERSSSNSDIIEYYNFFIDSSAGMGRYLIKTTEIYNNINDSLIEKSQTKEIYGSLETFHTHQKVIAMLTDLSLEGENLKLRPFENFSPNSYSTHKRHLYMAIRLQISLLYAAQKYFSARGSEKVKIKGFLITSGLDEQQDELQLWSAQKLIRNISKKHITYKIVVNKVYEDFIAQDLQCPDNIFYTGK